MVRKIKFWPAPQMEVRVDVTEQMVKDYRECKEIAEAAGEEIKDCDFCSWREVQFECTGMCEMKVMEKLLEETYDGK